MVYYSYKIVGFIDTKVNNWAEVSSTLLIHGGWVSVVTGPRGSHAFCRGVSAGQRGGGAGRGRGGVGGTQQLQQQAQSIGQHAVRDHAQVVLQHAERRPLLRRMPPAHTHHLYTNTLVNTDH